jgi:Cu(I)/Ag(I) efflux system membrane protein CusA/SilA
MLGHGSGSEVMQRIAAPMVGGMVTAPLLSMLIIPAAWLLLQRRRVARMKAYTQEALQPHVAPDGTLVPQTHSGENQ